MYLNSGENLKGIIPFLINFDVKQIQFVKINLSNYSY